MFRHVVMLQFEESATADQRAAVCDALRQLPAKVPEILSYSIGEDARVNEGNFDLVIVADFDHVDHYLVYRDHPAHVAVINELIRPILARRAAVQHEIRDA
jgi:hypothetical protein